jgi:hypothetical protein
MLSFRSLDGLPLTWGAKAHASICRRDLLYFADSWGSEGIFAPGLRERLSLFVGSGQEPRLRENSLDASWGRRPHAVARGPLQLSAKHHPITMANRATPHHRRIHPNLALMGLDRRA